MKRWILRMLQSSGIARYGVLYPVFWFGYFIYRIFGRTPVVSYCSLRLLYKPTRGRLNERLARWENRRHNPLNFEAPRGVLGEGADLSRVLDVAASDIESDGYHVFSRGLPADSVRALQEFARSRPALLVPAPASGRRTAIFDASRPEAPTYVLDESDVLAVPVIQDLLADSSLLLLAQRCLGGAPVLDAAVMWWSAAWNEASSEAAQLFHFDMDRLRWIKVFFYLSDVGHSNGPHVYVRGSHQRKAWKFYEDRRFSDAEVADAVAAPDIVRVVGSAGTIIAGNTLCLHKGDSVVEGSRLVLELVWATSLFGCPRPRVRLPRDLNDRLRQTMQRHPSVFAGFRQDPARQATSAVSGRSPNLQTHAGSR